MQCDGPGRGGGWATRPIILSYGNPTGKLRVRVCPRVGSGKIFSTGRVWVRVSIIGYGYGTGG